MAVAVKVREETALLRASKVNGQDATAGRQNPRDLSSELARRVGTMEHTAEQRF